MYRRGVRCVVLAVLAACGPEPAPTRPVVAPNRDDRPPPGERALDAGAPLLDAAPALPPNAYRTLGEALLAIIPADARVLGFGEIHNRTDRMQVTSALSQFTAALPAIGSRVSDLVLETWVADPSCGQKATTTTKQLETEVKRPEATKSEVVLLAEAARAANIQPHAMTLTCKDYETLAPKGQVDPVAMLTLTTRELTRIALSAVRHRTKHADPRPWIAVYGGALHNDRTPDPALAEWSYVAAVERVVKDRFVEIDLLVPELALADAKVKTQPWYELLVRAGPYVQVHARGPHSFVVVLPSTR